MGLADNMVSEFVKIVNEGNKGDKNKSTETIVNGTAVTYDGRTFVQIDGSDALVPTPVNSTVSMNDGNRVQVLIKDHTATVIGNLSDPSASSKTVKEHDGKISEFGIIIADKVSIDELEAERGRIDDLETDNLLVKKQLTAIDVNIQNLTAADVTITGRLDANDVTIKNLDAEKIDADIVEATYATIASLEATDAKVYNLSAVYGDFEVLATNKFQAIEADITSLETDKLSAANAELLYANIDFANIGEAAVKNLFAKSGIIKELTTGDAFITGELVGVTIDGNLIKGNTIIADKLVIKGKDGLYYQMNVDGGATVADGITQEQLQNGLHGDIIIANTITANKIKVKDLVAFGATIGGFDITDNSIHSHAKESVGSTVMGLYLDSDGQMNIGDDDQYLKFYFDEETQTYRMLISVDSVMFGGSGKSVETELTDLSKKVDDNQKTATSSSSSIEQLKNTLTQLVVDENGESLMTQTEESYILTDIVLEDDVISSFEMSLLENVTTETGESVFVYTTEDGLNHYATVINGVYYTVNHQPAMYVFDISDIQKSIGDSKDDIDTLNTWKGDTDTTIKNIIDNVEALSPLGSYIVIDEEMEVTNDDGTTETIPAIILGKKEDNEFRVIITNKQIAFCEGTDTPARISGKAFIAQKMVVEQELAQSTPDGCEVNGQFVWKIRANGNYGLSWKEGN